MNLTLSSITLYQASGLLMGVCAIAWLVVGLLLRIMPAVTLRMAGTDTLRAFRCC